MKKAKAEDIEKKRENYQNKNYKSSKEEKKKKRKWPIVLLVIVIIIGIAAGVFYYRIQKLGGGLKWNYSSYIRS